MGISFNNLSHGTALTSRVQGGLPTLGIRNSTYILVRNTVISYFKDLKNLFLFVGSSCTCALTVAAFIRDVPTLIATFDQITSGALSIWTPQSRAAFLTHMVSYYLRPIGINLMRGFFLTIVGAVVVSFISVPVRCYNNISVYGAQRESAIENARAIQLIADTIIQQIPNKNPKVYLDNALGLFQSEKEDKITIFSAVLQRIKQEKREMEDVTERDCNTLKKAIQKSISPLEPQAAYKELYELFLGERAPSEAPINAFFTQALEESWKTGKSAEQCLDLMIDGFKEPRFDGGTIQLLTLLKSREAHPEAFQVAALYQKLMTHANHYEAAVKQMQKIYGFEKPPLKIEELWQQQQ